MKPTTKLLLCTLCAAALLSGCGTAPAQPEGSASSAETARLAESMDRLRTANALETLMDKYTAVTRLNAWYQDEEQKEPWDSQLRQCVLERGQWQWLFQYTDQDGNTTSGVEGCGDGESIPAWYDTSSGADSPKSMILYPNEAAYRDDLSSQWDFPDIGVEEALSDEVEQNGVRVVTTQYKLAEMDRCYDLIRYEVDPESYEIQAVTVTEYNNQGEAIGLERRTVTYDEPQPAVFSAYQAITQGPDTCALTVVCDPRGENRVSRYSVAHDTFVIHDRLGYTFYKDAGLTEELLNRLDPLDSIDVSGAEVTVYLAPNPYP